MSASSYHSFIFSLWNLNWAWCGWPQDWLPYIPSTHCQPLPSDRSQRAWRKSARGVNNESYFSDLKSVLFQTMRLILSFCYRYTHGVASRCILCSRICESKQTKLTCSLAFCSTVLAFSSFPSALDNSSALGGDRGHSSWKFWYSSIKNFGVVFASWAQQKLASLENSQVCCSSEAQDFFGMANSSRQM